MMYLPNGEEIIGPETFHIYVDNDPIVDGVRRARGLKTRDPVLFPQGCYASAPPAQLKLVDPSTYDERIKDLAANLAQVSDIRLRGNAGKMIPSLDQDGYGYCWMHSGASVVTLLRAMANQPYVPLSAFACACMIKNYRNEGGWGAEGVDFLTNKGIPSSAHWPMQSVDPRNDNPETWANAALHKVMSGWMDLNMAVYNRKLTAAQQWTILLTIGPIVGDFDWWGHSVAIMDMVNGKAQRANTRSESGKILSLAAFERMWGFDTDAQGYGARIWNSWGDSWSNNGTGVLTGNQCIPDKAVAPNVVRASAA